ncbi:hypothetical protein Tco_1101228 [Tanacetum coccineum]
MNQHVVFLVSNVIVIICYVLSRDHNDAGNEISGECTDTPVIDSPLKLPENVLPVEVKSPETDTPVEVMVIKQAVKQIERFNRSQSEKLKSEITTKPRRELRRSVTEKRRSMVKRDGDDVEKVTSSKNEVERLSNEEFRIAIETFISKQQTLIKQQSVESVIKLRRPATLFIGDENRSGKVLHISRVENVGFDLVRGYLCPSLIEGHTAKGVGLRVTNSHIGNHREDDFTLLETIRRFLGVIGSRSLSSSEGQPSSRIGGVNLLITKF